MAKLLLKLNRKLMVITAMVIVVMIGIAGTTPPAQHPNVYKNLKILPQDITREQMHNIMEGQFGDGLGVDCDYCHAKDAGADHPDFASDANPKKDIAREMMTMVLQLNKENFKVQKPMIGDSLMVVTCYTCHHGAANPDTKNKIAAAKDWGPPKK